MRLVVATRSADKLREIRAILRSVPGLELLDLEDAGVPPSPEEESIEVYDTFAENARAKARYFRLRTGLPTIADDSGLEVEVLGGRPGVRSRRFHPEAGRIPREELDRANNDHLLELLGDTELAQRRAAYVCVAALELGEGEVYLFEGRSEGLILGHPKGWGGFGYDPLFFDPASGRTYAELSPGEKHARSHRGHAFRALAEWFVARQGEQS